MDELELGVGVVAGLPPLLDPPHATAPSAVIVATAVSEMRLLFMRKALR